MPESLPDSPLVELPRTCRPRDDRGRRLLLIGALLWASDLGHRPVVAGTAIEFVEASAAVGLVSVHQIPGLTGVDWSAEELSRRISGGVAAGDYDRDGAVDLYTVSGGSGPNMLFRNLGDGTFEETAAAAGVAVSGEIGSGPTFADVDGDGWLDLLINGVHGTGVRLFRNQTDGTFVESTAESGLGQTRDSFSAALGDIDMDGDLDLLQARWMGQTPCPTPCDGHLWTNDGAAHFTDIGAARGVVYTDQDMTFSPNFADIDEDAMPDLLLASDFDTSRVYLNQGSDQPTFLDVSDPDVLTDEAGMGAAVGDYDNDGDLDWFVSSIYSAPPIGTGDKTGNRLYRNLGDGSFEEVSEAAGVRRGYWGWGACFADFDNDGHLDLFHVNGWRSGFPAFDASADPSRLFMSEGDGTFVERSAEYGLVDTGQGRGVVCFDPDQDGDLDIFVANNNQPAAFYRNDGGNANGFLNLRLRATEAGTQAVGARVYAVTGATTQMREVRCGSSFVSQQPQELHFGLADATIVDSLLVHWPDGQVDSYENVPVNRFLGLTTGVLCVRDLALAHEVGEPESHTACQTIVGAAGGGVLAGGELALRAGTSVILEEGFWVSLGGVLGVELDPLLAELRR